MGGTESDLFGRLICQGPLEFSPRPVASFQAQLLGTLTASTEARGDTTGDTLKSYYSTQCCGQSSPQYPFTCLGVYP